MSSLIFTSKPNLVISSSRTILFHMLPGEDRSNLVGRTSFDKLKYTNKARWSFLQEINHLFSKIKGLYLVWSFSQTFRERAMQLSEINPFVINHTILSLKYSNCEIPKNLLKYAITKNEEPFFLQVCQEYYYCHIFNLSIILKT